MYSMVDKSYGIDTRWSISGGGACTVTCSFSPNPNFIFRLQLKYLFPLPLYHRYFMYLPSLGSAAAVRIRGTDMSDPRHSYEWVQKLETRLECRAIYNMEQCTWESRLNPCCTRNLLHVLSFDLPPTQMTQLTTVTKASGPLSKADRL